MVVEHAAVHVHPESELALVLRRAAGSGETVVVITGDERFEIEVHPATVDETLDRALPSATQVARSIAGIRKAAGGWKDLVDVDEVTSELYARRQMVSRPSVDL